MGIEANILLTLQAFRMEGLNQFMALVSALGNYGIIWFAAAAFMLIFVQKRHRAVAALISLAAIVLLAHFVFDPLALRARPCSTEGVEGLFAIQGVSTAGTSFPSLAAAAAAAFTTVLALTSSRGPAAAALATTLLIALSRLYVGLEYPTDILAGALEGGIIATLVVGVLRTFFRGFHSLRKHGKHSM